MLKKLSMLLIIAIIPTVTYAHDNPAESSTCYIFKNNKLALKGKCVIESGGGAGGSWTNITFNKKKYSYELNEQETMNPTKEYYRDAKTLKPVKASNVSINSPYLICNRYTPTDICFLSK